MKTLKQKEEEFWEEYKEQKDWDKIGIACDKCGTELEGDMTKTLLSNPPQRNVRCPKCGWKGYTHC